MYIQIYVYTDICIYRYMCIYSPYSEPKLPIDPNSIHKNI